MNNSKNSEADRMKEILKNSGMQQSKITALSEEDIRRKIRSVDRNEVMRKLQAMGLGSAAQKLKTLSDEDLIRMISNNPMLLKKLNSLLK